MTLPSRKPRIALMGEFSAGKSTLSNLLLGARPLPEKVTATRLSPVWMSFGNEAPYRVGVDGTEEQITIADLDNIPVEETRVVRLFFEADILNICDLIDFPGISDPNMSADVWQRVLEEVDAVLWCTHATQAWRQSEAAVWDTMPEAVRARSALLITRFDKLTTERDKMRVLKRLEKETKGLFAATFPISLTDALAAGDDYEAFEESGGIDFLQFFLEMIDDLAKLVEHTSQTLYTNSQSPEALAAIKAAAAAEVADVAVVEAVAPRVSRIVAEVVQAEQEGPAISPRRVKPKVSETRHSRPRSRTKMIDMSSDALEGIETTLERPRNARTRDLRAALSEENSKV